MDFLPINDGNITLAPNTSRVFEVLWLGFGDQFLADDGTVTTVFTTPSEYYQDFAHLDIAFWQKAEITKRSHPLTLKTELSTWSPSDGSETKQEIEDQTFTLRYPVLTTRLNTGLVINLAVILILLLLLWE